MLGHMGIRPIIANSIPINNKIRIQIMPNNELQLYTTYDMRYMKPLDTIDRTVKKDAICLNVHTFSQHRDNCTKIDRYMHVYMPTRSSQINLIRKIAMI